VLLELAESGDTGAVARHYNISKQTLYNWKSNFNRKNKRFENRQIEDSRHFQTLLKLKQENAKLKERVKLLRDIVKKTDKNRSCKRPPKSGLLFIVLFVLKIRSISKKC